MVDLAENLLSLGDDALARFRQSYLALGPIKQTHTKFFLELADLLAEWRLADAQANGGAAEVQLFRNSHKVCEDGEVPCREISDKSA